MKSSVGGASSFGFLPATGLAFIAGASSFVFLPATGLAFIAGAAKAAVLTYPSLARPPEMI